MGFYLDASNVYHGFVRATDGTITTFSASDAGTGPFQGTYAFSINRSGAITGLTIDGNNVFHGYLRATDGTITIFDVPGQGTGPNQGTNAENINSTGVIAGWFT